jgi:hypothetical protein
MSKRKNNKRTNNDLQNTAQKTEDQTTRTALKTVGALRCSGRVGSSSSNIDTRCVTIATKPVISHEHLCG